MSKENRNCPYCLSPVEPEQERVRCPSCGIVHHEACWRQNGKCSAHGCDGWALWDSRIADSVAPKTDAPLDFEHPVENQAKTRRKQRAEAQDPVLCFKCGQPIRPGKLICWRCRLGASDSHYFENCFGPAVLLVAGITTILTLIVKALI